MVTKIKIVKTTPKTVFDPRYKAMISALIAMRKKEGLSQRDLAGLMDRPRTFIARTEVRERRLDFIDIVDLLKAMGRSESEILKFLKEFI